MRGAPFLIACLILLAVASRIWMIPRQIGLDSNEGWNAFLALKAVGPGSLYPAANSMIGNNYPPLSFIIIGWLSKFNGDPIVIGRLLALASVVGIAGVLAAILRRFAVPARVAFGGGALFLLLNASLLRPYLAMNDPQWFGHLIMMVSVLTLIPAASNESPRRLQVFGAAILVLAGGLVKHNLVAWPLAMTVWLAWHYRGLLLVWIGTLVVGGLVALALCRFEFGPDFIADIMGTRSYSIERMVRHAIIPLVIMIVALVYARPLIQLRSSDPRIDLILLAIGIAVPLGIIQRSGAGVDINAHFEAAIALCLACSLAFARARREWMLWLAAFSAVALFAVSFALELTEIRRMRAAERSWSAMQRRIAAVPGPVACVTQALCFWAGKSFEIDFFLYGQRARAERGAPLLERALAERRFAAIQLSRPLQPVTPEPLVELIEAHMRPVYVAEDGRQLLVPR